MWLHGPKLDKEYLSLTSQTQQTAKENRQGQNRAKRKLIYYRFHEGKIEAELYRSTNIVIISEESISKKLKTLNPGKSPGPDLVHLRV